MPVRTIASPVGPLRIVVEDGHLRALDFADENTPPHRGDADDTLDETERQLIAYFKGHLRSFDLPLAPIGTDFQQRVWQELRHIPYGETRTYADIALALGRPSATRAVGAANGRNPIAIVVPCHRVIGSDGTLTGYAGGLHRKTRLLELERPATQEQLFARPAPRTVPYAPERLPIDEGLARLRARYDHADRRRSVRSFSTDAVPREAIELAIATAGTAPSGAHRQPWHFVAVSDPALKRTIRDAAEGEERRFYEERASDEWLEALEPLGTDFHKEHITDAPWLIVVFRRDVEVVDGRRTPNYYVSESVGIAVGMLIAALHEAGLATLTHTPAPMTFLRDLLGRPKEEKPYVLMPVGWPAPGCRVPDLHRKPLAEIATFL